MPPGIDDLLRNPGPDPEAAARRLAAAGFVHLAAWIDELVSWRSSGPDAALAADRVPGLEACVEAQEKALRASDAYAIFVLPVVAQACTELPADQVERISACARRSADAGAAATLARSRVLEERARSAAGG